MKKLGKIGRVGHRIHGDRRARVRGIGWEAVHVAIDDGTRLAYAEVLPDETKGGHRGLPDARATLLRLPWNRKAERFIRTLLVEWAYAQSYPYQRRAHRQTHALSWLLQHGPTPHGDPRPDARAEARDTVNNVLINNS